MLDYVEGTTTIWWITQLLCTNIHYFHVDRWFLLCDWCYIRQCIITFHFFLQNVLRILNYLFFNLISWGSFVWCFCDASVWDSYCPPWSYNILAFKKWWYILFSSMVFFRTIMVLKSKLLYMWWSMKNNRPSVSIMSGCTLKNSFV